MRSLLTFVSVAACVVVFARAAHADAPPLIEPGTTVVTEPEPAPVGACIGGDCRPERAPERETYRPRDFSRFALGGAVFGAVSAGLSLGGTIAIAVARDQGSERITRGIWLSYVGVATPLVAFSSFLARRGADYPGSKAVRRIGWLAYGIAITHGIVQWYGAFRDYPTRPGLTILAGSMGALALLPHALDALNASRHARRPRIGRVVIAPTGLSLRF